MEQQQQSQYQSEMVLLGRRMKTPVIVTILLLMSSCATMVGPKGIHETDCVKFIECSEAPITIELPTHEKLLNLPPAKVPPVVAVYAFSDLTGQRKQKGNAAMFSTAVSQGTNTMLIDALKTAGNGKWFRVVERVGLDNLTRERQIVKTTRAAYEETTTLAPMLFAGIILEGGIIGYDTNIETGGRGARYLGVGMQQAYRRDIVVVHLRAVSVLTGEIILNVQTSKTILSVATGYDVFKFVELDTQLVEIEDGMTENESVTRSVRSAIEAAVYELILQGDNRGFWTIYDDTEEEETIIEEEEKDENIE